jgi:tryptophan-rich sensory protein
MLAIVEALLASRAAAAAIMWLSVLLRKSVWIRLVQFLAAIVVHAFEIVFRHVQMIQMARLMLGMIALLRVTCRK